MIERCVLVWEKQVKCFIALYQKVQLVWGIVGQIWALEEVEIIWDLTAVWEYLFTRRAEEELFRG